MLYNFIIGLENVLRITTSFPLDNNFLKGLMQSRKLRLNNFSEKYYYKYLEYINCCYGFNGKVVAEFGSDVSLQCARAVLKLGAKKYYAVNPDIPPSNESIINENLYVIRELGENTQLESDSMDLIFGIAFLEHVRNPSSLAREVFRLLKRGGMRFLQGIQCGLGITAIIVIFVVGVDVNIVLMARVIYSIIGITCLRLPTANSKNMQKAKTSPMKMLISYTTLYLKILAYRD